MAFLKETETKPASAVDALVSANVELEYNPEKDYFIVVGKDGDGEQYLALFDFGLDKFMAGRTVARMGDMGEYRAHAVQWGEVWKYRGLWARCDCTELAHGDHMIHACRIPDSVVEAWNNA